MKPYQRMSQSCLVLLLDIGQCSAEVISPCRLEGTMLALAALLVVVLVGLAAFFALSKAKQDGTQAVEVEATTGPRATRARGMQGRMHAGQLRNRAQAARPQAPVDVDSDDEGSWDEDGDSEEDDGGPAAGRGRRRDKRKKKGRGREAQGEAAEAAAAAKGARQAAYAEKQRAKELAREAQEAEIKRAAEEKAQQEDEEAAKWMSMISVEQHGSGEAEDAQENAGLLGQFIEYITARKTVPLEQLATDFKLRTTDVIDRIHGLEAMGRLTGVMDERGKYIYISLDEMKAVADFMVQKGRVPIAELATKSSTLIDLEPKAAAAAALHSNAGMDFDALLAA